MATDIENLFEGSYLYYQNGQNYSEENFTVDLIAGAGVYLYRSEILSRVETGEFFKMKIRYEVNKFFVPQTVVVEKSLGERYSMEKITVDQNTQNLTYSFTSDKGEKSVERPFGAKHFIMAPCFLTSALFSISKKIESSSRTPVTFITCPNEWDYTHPPEDKTLYVQLNTHNDEEFIVNGTPLAALKYDIFEQDNLEGVGKPAAQLWVSKNLGIPYQMESNDGSKMVIKRMKKLKTDLEKIF